MIAWLCYPEMDPAATNTFVPTDLKRIVESENANFGTTTAYLGPTLELAQDFSDLYQKLIERFLLSPKEKTAEQQKAAGVVLHLLMKCQKDFALSVLNLLRGYRSTSQLFLRASIEAVAFAVRITKHPHLGGIWLDAVEGPKEYERFKDKFTNLFPKDDELLQRLYERYDRCSQSLHNSIYSMAGNMSYEQVGDKALIRFNAFDLPEGHHVVSVLYSILDSHMLILKAFVQALKGHLGEMVEWETRYNSVEAKLNVHRERWKPVVLAASEMD